MNNRLDWIRNNNATGLYDSNGHDVSYLLDLISALQAHGAVLRAENAELRARNRQLEIEEQLDIREIGRMGIEMDELAARLDAQGQHPGFPQPDPDEPVAGTA